jgi:hypothetical protein
MFPEVWRAIVGRDSLAERAQVTGYVVHRVRDGVYPVMLEAGSDSVVDGLVYRGVEASVIATLDAYESELYNRVEIAATFDTGETAPAQAYVLPKSRRQFSSGEPWDGATFAREQLAQYLRRIHVE